jgi:hypothetical protein
MSLVSLRKYRHNVVITHDIGSCAFFEQFVDEFEDTGFVLDAPQLVQCQHRLLLHMLLQTQCTRATIWEGKEMGDTDVNANDYMGAARLQGIENILILLMAAARATR